MTILTNIINKDVFLLKKESSLFDFNDNSSNLQNTFDLRTFGPDFFNESINIVESMEKIPLSPLAKYGYVQGDNTFISRISNELGINAQSCLTTNGAGHALDLCLSVLVNDGCRILIPKPYFPAYPRLIRLNGGIPTFYSVEVCDNSIYENIKVELNKGTKVLIINNPHNPTGRSISQELTQAIIDLALLHSAIVIFDFAYQWFLDDFSVPESDNVISLFSMGKNFCLPGLRLGLVHSKNKDFMKILLEVKRHSVFYTCHISELIGSHMANSPRLAEIKMRLKEKLQYRREIITEYFNSLNLNTLLPSLGFYFYPIFSEKFHSREIRGLPGNLFGGSELSKRYCLAINDNDWNELESNIFGLKNESK